MRRLFHSNGSFARHALVIVGAIATLWACGSAAEAVDARALLHRDWYVDTGKLDLDGTARVRRTVVLTDGRKVAYTARAGFIPLRIHETGEITGEMFFVAFTADRDSAAPVRPITFYWGGGPGVAATLANEGPLKLSSDASKLIDKSDTPLEFTDMVFMDPIGTGYSRMTKPEFAHLFFNPAGDAESTVEFMRIYLKRYDSSSSASIFVSGESYATLRSALVAEIAMRRRLPFRGAILSSSGLFYSYPIDDLTYALTLPSFTAAAQFHGKLASDMQSNLGTALEQSERFALNEYLPFLARGNTVSDTERQAILAKLARFTGVDASVFDRVNLRLKATDFCRELLRKDGYEINAYDTRQKVAATPGSTTEASDATQWPSGSAVTSKMERLLLAQELGIHTDRQFVGPFGGEWPPPVSAQGDWMAVKWFGPNLSLDDAPAPGVEMARPALLKAVEHSASAPQVLMSGGLFDVVTPYFAADYVASRATGEFRDRFVVSHRPTGHEGGPSIDEQRAFYRRVLASPPKLHKSIAPDH